MKNKTISPIMKNSRALLRITSTERGVLLLHGFKGAPAEMKYLGERISERGYSISIPRLPGHGTVIQDLARTSARDWLTAAREALVELKSHCREVYVAGLSMGAILTLLLAREYEIPKIVILSAPRTLKEKSIYLAPLIGLFIKILWQEDPTKGLASEEARLVHECYSQGTPIMQAWQLFRLIKKAMRALPFVKSDALIIQSAGDQVIPPDSIDYIHARLASRKKEKYLLKKSDHAITADLEKELVAERVIEFFDSPPGPLSKS